MKRPLPITPPTLHKDTQDDVLIKDFIDVLPALIHTEVAVAMLEDWDANQAHLFLSIYLRCSESYALRTLPYIIEKSQIGQFSSFEVNLSEFYRESGGKWILMQNYVPKSVEECIRGRLLPCVAPVNPTEAAAMASQLVEANAWCKSSVHSYKMINDTENYFFYRKRHEHVPGLMQIEVARQSMYHYFYSTSGYKYGDVSISISSLDVEFRDYMTSVYEVEILVMQSSQLLRKLPKYVDKTATFFQCGRRVAHVRLQGGAMRMEIFKRKRSTGFPFDHWFRTSNRISRKSLVNMDGGSILQAELHSFSMTGVRLNLIDGGTTELDWSAARTVCLYLQGTGFVLLPLSGNACFDGPTSVVLPFGVLSRIQSNHVKDLIKCDGFFSCAAPEIESASKLSNINVRLAVNSVGE